MCGILGAHSFHRSWNARLLRAALRRMHSRGPDGDGLWLSDDGKTAIGHRRLSVVAPDDGAQPIASEDERTTIAVNGEFYGAARIRAELIQRGHRFRTQSDSEIALHLYEERGLDFVHALRGEFALVLWDDRRRRLLAVRDRFGVKPLYYSARDDEIVIASSAKALFSLGVVAAWDATSFHQTAAMQYLLPHQSLFRGVQQLPPASRLCFDAAGVRIDRYWRIPVPAEPSAAAVEARDQIEQCREAVVDAVAVRLKADVPVCCHLSGGLDSSAVFGIAAHRRGRPLEAFTVGHDAEGYDERNLADATARCLGGKLHVVEVTADDVMQHLFAAVAASEGLCINGHLVAKYLLNRAIHRAGYKVALSGEGADELFAGYGHVRVDLWRSQRRDDLVRRLMRSNGTSLGMMLTEQAAPLLPEVRRRLGFVPAWMEAKAALGARIGSLLNDDFVAAYDEHEPFGEFIDAVTAEEPVAAADPAATSLHLWSRSALPNYILATLGDGTEAAHSVEGRVPFLDHCLWESLADLPINLKIRGATEKYVLREAVREFVPDQTYRREKHPFDTPPVGQFAFDAWRNWLRDLIDGPGFAAQPFFSGSRVQQLLDDLNDADDGTRLVWDPVLMTVASTIAVQELINNEATSRSATLAASS